MRPCKPSQYLNESWNRRPPGAALRKFWRNRSVVGPPILSGARERLATVWLNPVASQQESPDKKTLFKDIHNL
jgi:hypothetical protein